MDRRKWVINLVSEVARIDQPTAELLVDRLIEENLLNLGYGDPDVDAVVTKFSETFGTTKTSKYDRFAARRLTTKYGRQAVCGIIELLASSSTEKYAPIVGSIAQLEDKWVSVLNFLRKQKGEELIDV